MGSLFYLYHFYFSVYVNAVEFQEEMWKDSHEMIYFFSGIHVKKIQFVFLFILKNENQIRLVK